ncbi:hypothetical protein BT96DRAFT_944302 [Gymnopus androsaceus JB14]|uniref:Uncharacterized protein n=1 Tax=Gymnopus androsaceus JB14 TaxID=1447944 RepID=A0A6A4H5D2_9AGAR|nr:hypothetical protein BT96DRAFT_944302 [Gymnopus androsaceus JB14]
MERKLARIRSLLGKQYGNDYDMSYAWLDPETGNKVPLSPLAIDEWTRAIYSGMTDKFKPPSNPDSPHFGAINRQSSFQTFAARNSLVSRCYPEATDSAPVSDLAHIANILAIIGPNASKVSNPTPAESSATSSATSSLSSPVKNTPTKLRRFLEHAKKDLGVVDATLFHYRMEDKGYGLDILHEVPDSDLKELGVRPGDVLHLKRGAPLWFNGPDAK